MFKEKLEQEFLLGNEAIARGALEAGVDFVTGYPGTPSTEIIETLARDAEKYGFYVEWSTNEMVAFENAIGASLTGLRTMVTMKHAGLNWIADPLSVAVSSGVRGGMVIVTADDPNAHSSANEQDNRFYGMFFNLLTLEPSDAQEAKDMIIDAFSLSEKVELPVILRSVTRIGHARANVLLGEIPQRSRQAHFDRDPERFYVTGKRSMERRWWQLRQLALIEKTVEDLRFNRFDGTGKEKTCIVAPGTAYAYTRDALRLLKSDEAGILKIGSVYPLPKSLIKEMLSGKETVLVVEEGAPFVELQLRALAQDFPVPIRILGKMSGDMPGAGELNVDIVAKAAAKLLGKKEPKIDFPQEVWQEVQEILPPRTMVFCAGCPHSGTMYALKTAMNRLPVKPLIAGDIGCYTLMSFPPHQLGDVKYSMGASISAASGLSKALKQKTVAVIGDSTFIHAGIPGLINCLYNKSNVLVVLCDNSTSAMTGGQPHAGSGITVTQQPTKQVNLEELVKGCGVEFIEVTDPYDIKGTEEALTKALNYEGVSVVITRRGCALQATREASRTGNIPAPYRVDQEKCIAGELPFCQAACPLHVDTRGYIALIREGNYDGALGLIRQTLPFPGIIGRVCPHPCEQNCKRADVDEPIAINALKRAAADYAKASVPESFDLPEEKTETIAIVGSGPAGLMAAHDLRRMGYKVTIFEALPVLGGMLSVGIPEFRLPRDILHTELGIMEKLGVEIRTDTRVGDDVKLSELKKDYDAIFLAIGAHQGKSLGIENDAIEGVVDGVEFLHDVNMGKKSEARDKVVLVGGGNVAVDCARTCVRLGFKEVVILYRRSREEMPAIDEDIEMAEEEGVKITYLSAPVKVLAEDGRVQGVACIRTELGEPDASGRRRPIPVEGSEFTLETDMVISAVGEQPDLSTLEDGEPALSVKGGLLEVNPVTLETGLPGIFAGGDAVTGPAYVIDALAAGKKAAISIDRSIRGEDLEVGRETEGPCTTALVMNTGGVDKNPRQTAKTISADRRRTSFGEVGLGLSQGRAQKEAERCLSCGCSACIKSLACPAITMDEAKILIDESLCPGCGICAQICPVDAIITR